jgi:septal ring factor EnvC (AmiA/AmiB activator)
LATLLLLAIDPCQGQEADRAQTEARLRTLESEIAGLQRALEDARTRQKSEQNRLRNLDLELQEAARASRRLGAELAAGRDEVARLRRERDLSLDALGLEQEQLEAQLLAAWRASRESRLKLVLAMDSPAGLGRLLGYYEHFSTLQARRVEQLRIALQKLERTGRQLELELEQLADTERRQRERQEELVALRTTQRELLERLDRDLESEGARLETLLRDRRDLESLLERLRDALADIPADIGDGTHPRELKGRLPMPAQGAVARAYGQPRSAGLRWQGWLIRAPQGADVRTVAYGRVAYADWLRGYGLLIIVDHGEGFMSLYGHNESLLAEVGDWVQTGAVIATVGRNTDQAAGVYFELRSDGKALDPASWVQRR